MPSLSADQAEIMAALRTRVGNARGPRYWRALDELIDEPAFRRHLHDALPQVSQLAPALDRRAFLKLLGASLALAGLGACSGPPPERILPWIQQPEGVPDSLPQFYATTLCAGGNVAGVLVETHQGRPTKIEGNPAHPASLGGTDPLLQAAVLELWDPDRSQSPVHQGVASTWDAFATEAAALQRRFEPDGRGLHVLSGTIRSPTLARQRREFLARFPGAAWHQYEAVDEDNALAGAMLAFGRPLQMRLRLDQAAVIVSLGADFLYEMPGHLRHARDYADRRKRVLEGFTGRDPSSAPTPGRLYAIEATPSLTSANADHSWPLAESALPAFARELAAALGIADAAGGPASGMPERRVQAIAADLRANRGQSLLLAGPSLPAEVHALVHRLNAALGNVGRTLDYFEPAEPREASAASLQALTAAMSGGMVEALVILDGNPAYATPGELGFPELLAKVPLSVHLGLHRDETGVACHWHLPATHALESWSDLRAFDGSASLVQPVISPLYDGRSMHQLLDLLTGSGGAPPIDLVRVTWDGVLDEAGWQQSLRQGVIGGSAPHAVGATASAAPSVELSHETQGSDIELLFRPDPHIRDGHYANNGWLQELPKPLSHLTWSNAALVSPRLAAELALGNGDVIRIAANGRELEAPVWIMPGQAERSITLPMGYGRLVAGHVGEKLGFDANALRHAASPWRIEGARLTKTDRHVALASTQQHHRMEGRDPVHRMTLAAFLANPPAKTPERRSLYPPRLQKSGAEGYAWGMSIDLDACIGCNACTAACQAENNIPVVGAEEVRRGREMHWIRVDRYYEGRPEAPATWHQPVPCMHCEHAPCEVVCPVGATVHDSEGLNLQVYNRCVGTRFCSNNCPYKVRRFNFLQYADLDTPQLEAQRNPDVSVRNRGVMEKCTYCIQRIRVARIGADREGRRIEDGEIATACEAACPTRAITFGNVADPDSAVSREKASPRSYALLEELNTRPRTTYLAALRNPNPALEDES
ncbi:MAG: TAT-variant-translocated molybdopterin oxidoreductase [Xanthomonadales bacterium]|nr:TAT-variant-translocated molybdopterin oxidoreductase [Xanthomonadales bacterium]